MLYVLCGTCGRLGFDPVADATSGPGDPSALLRSITLWGPRRRGRRWQRHDRNGDGTFQAPHAISTGANPYSVAVADIDRDGALDLVAADFGGAAISLMRGICNR